MTSIVEQWPGGRAYETWDGGTQVGWGTVTAWEPPRRLVMTWAGTLAPTEVEFSFAVRPGADPGGGRAPRLGGADRRATVAGLRAARRLQLRRLLGGLGRDLEPPGRGVRHSQPRLLQERYEGGVGRSQAKGRPIYEFPSMLHTWLMGY